MDDRFENLTTWVRRFPGLANAKPEPASEDASFRRYFRVRVDHNQGSDTHRNNSAGRAGYEAAETLIVMDAPPPQEDCHPFVAIAGHFESLGLNSVRVLEADFEHGYLLLSDLGSVQYLDVLSAEPEQAETLYKNALDTLLELQAGGAKFQQLLPPYDEERLHKEMELFKDWLCERHLGIEFSPREADAWQTLCKQLAVNAVAQPHTVVHRDYHSRNLMVTKCNSPGVLDFQDAVEGPLTYDLVSLLKDCYIKWPTEQIHEYVAYFQSRSPFVSERSPCDFVRDFDLMGVQRHLKASGIFARLLHRDGKANYLKDVPRTLSYIVDITSKYKELDFLGELVSERLLPALEAERE